ncbi:TonB-dependent receptor [Sphingomonas koreensis]|jgi:iron complex outermembrane receptor protein|uniref:TonB-dependent receptor n=1 Tax=Sphingomonas koreensis TaxID=93064 RepID=A0AAJ4RZR7_9SPHN|nr:TonB-dependent receptor [Sphingomonas koreensis]MDC7810411.1 TonB-dependent receptor [Sphingomonas koreensis]RSU17550.1 TonB-dependent receptor [Sphingomonas koreensis]RSU21806.1 TonB-dependent receptor [Sphingomonas koreensis]RSU26174.1 TonB-dependent receptor [Sphingomonas koreensis]RSU29892.1 TonB-dependent receptor [Sphingomonas koreensis]
MKFRRALLLCAVAGGALTLAQPAFAQDAPAAEEAAPAEEEILVTGIRASERAAIDIKRNAVAVVDSIVAEDLGKLPDQNVAESLQRVAGVTIERNRGEGRYVTVRGFGPKFNAVTVNGRTLATDNNGREFSFDVIPSEIISGADVYKSPQANLNGSSIGATINVKTLRPLDQKTGFKFAGAATGMWSEIADSWNPEFSGVASWKNDAGTFGVALAGVWAKQDNRIDEFTIGAGHVRRSSTDSYYTAGGVAGARVGPGVTPFSGVSMPSNLSPFFFEREMTRWGFNAAVQMRPSDKLTVTIDALVSKARFIEQQTGLAYDFSGGTLVEQVVKGGSIVNGVQTGGEAVYQRYVGGFVDQIIQYDDRNVTTSQFGINVDWRPTDDLKVGLDMSLSDARKRGHANNLFTTIRRKNIDHWFDRRSGSPIYDYGFTSPNYANAATNPQGVTAHYYIWGGGSDGDDEIEEYKADVEWKPGGGNLTLTAGVMASSRIKSIDGYETPFDQQCRYCGSDRVLPASLFESTGRNFFASHDGNILRDWLIYDPHALVRQVDQFASQDGLVFDPAVRSATASSVIDEKVKSAYLMGSLDTEVAGMPLVINLGLRYENTDYTSSGASRTIVSARPRLDANGNPTGQNDIILTPTAVPVNFRGKYDDWLPSLNMRLSVTDDLILRFAASKVMTRPTLTDLSPRMSIQTNPGNETIRRGNPDLQPFRADQVELGAEWYFARDSLINVAAFYKKIGSFVTTVTTDEIVDQIKFRVTVPANGKGATVKGFEVGYRQSFGNWLPAPFDGFGVQTSFNYTESDAQYPSIVAGRSYSLEGLSEYSYSLVGFYEKYGVQARVAYTYRDDFLQTAIGRNSEQEYFKGYGQLDVSLAYDVTSNFTIFADAVNLNNAKEFLYSMSEDRTKEYRTTGRRVSAGVRVRF